MAEILRSWTPPPECIEHWNKVRRGINIEAYVLKVKDPAARRRAAMMMLAKMNGASPKNDLDARRIHGRNVSPSDWRRLEQEASYGRVR